VVPYHPQLLALRQQIRQRQRQAAQQPSRPADITTAGMVGERADVQRQGTGRASPSGWSSR
jgi:hypothetical protein